MRTTLLLSTAAVALMLASPTAFAQSNPDKKPEAAKEQTHKAKQEQRTEQQSKENKAAESQQSKPDQSKAAQSEQPKQQSASDRQQHEQRNSQKSAQQPKSDRAAKDKTEPQSGKAAATKSPSTTGQSTSDQQKSSDTQKKAGEPSTSSPSATRSTTSSDKSSPANSAAGGSAATNTGAASTTTNSTSTRNTAQQSTTDVNAQLTPEKQTRISETISRTRDVAPTVRDLRVSINIGTRVPEHVHLHRLPSEIVSIEPAYREYEYFTTERDVVVVNPRTRQVVTMISRDASSARAQGGSSSTQMSTMSRGSSSGSSIASGSSMASGSLPCEVMRREASGQTVPVDPSDLSRSTTGSGSTDNNRLSVTVQAPNGQSMPPITLPDQMGQIVVGTDGGDCKITIEPGVR